MNDIVSGKINCVIVKDLSRLGREYIETGRYLRQVFPTYLIEYVKVLKRLDRLGKLPPDLREILDTLLAMEKEAA